MTEASFQELSGGGSWGTLLSKLVHGHADTCACTRKSNPISSMLIEDALLATKAGVL
jgi:hypothetical protein